MIWMVQVPLRKRCDAILSRDIKNHSIPGLTKGKQGVAHAGGDVVHKVPALVLFTMEVWTIHLALLKSIAFSIK